MKIKIALAIALISGVLKAQVDSGSISGTISMHSTGVSGAKVRLYRRTCSDGYVNFFLRCSTNTDEKGEYQCEHLPEGQFLLAVVPPTARAQTDKPTSDSVPPITFYPGVNDAWDAQLVDLSPNGNAWADLSIHEAVLSSIRGEVESHPANVFSTLLAAITNKMGIDTEIPLLYDKEKGELSGPLIAGGHYIIQSSIFSDGTEYRSSTPLLSGDGSASNFVVEANSVRLDGQLTGKLADKVKTIHLLEDSGEIPEITTEVRNGRFKFHPIPSGIYHLRVDDNSPLHIDAVILGDKNFAGNKISLSTASYDQHLTAHIAESSFMLKGYVQTNDSPASLRNKIVAYSKETDDVYVVDSNEAGQFTLQGLNPGHYLLFCFTRDSQMAFRQPNVLKKLENDSVEISLGDGLPTNIKLTPIAKIFY